MKQPFLAHILVLSAVLSCWFPADGLKAELLITEFLAQNTSGLSDQDSEASDWIELHNPGGVPLDLDGYGLSDDGDEPMQWVFPPLILPPGAYLVVFASGKDRRDPAQELHANFALRAEGEYLGLASPVGATIQAYTPGFPPQLPDIAYGTPHGATASAYLDPPTPGLENAAEGFVGKLEKVSFSHPRGYYSRPIPLRLDTDDAEAQIFYTTDGSPPTPLASRLYHEAIWIYETSVIRALAIRDGYIPGTLITQSYLVAGDVKHQPDMSQVVVHDPATADMTEELQALPVMSLAMNAADFFGPNGIYEKFSAHGIDAEVPVSIEYFDPSDSEDRFHVDGGIRIHGAQARIHEKKPLRLYFRSAYGAGRLNHPLFEGSPVQSFDQLLLRGGGHDAWTTDWGFGRNDLTETASYLRDQFMREAETDMGILSPRGKFVQLFINGAYHGLYNLHERADETFYADHEGGTPEDWDVIAAGGSVTGGNGDEWGELQGLAEEGIADARAYAEIQAYLDMPAFADALTSRIWSGDHDWLGPTYFGNFKITGNNNRNWFAGRRSRNAGDPTAFLFHTWDAEISMGNDRFSSSGNRETSFDLSRVDSPQSAGAPYDALRGYEEFRMVFADRLHQHFGPGGALSPEVNQARLDALADAIRPALAAESARWGHIHGGIPLRRDVEWESEYNWLRNTFLPVRHNLVVQQFRNRGLLSLVEAPAVSLPAGRYPTPQELSLSLTNAPAGTIYYTLDGRDPRQATQTEITVLVGGYSPASVLIPSPANGGSTLGNSWKGITPPANIANWQTGETGVGYEVTGTDYRDYIRLDVETEMAGTTGSAFIRMPFLIETQEQIDAIDKLLLKMRYDDGYVAYLNGVEVARRNAPTTPQWDSIASTFHLDSSATVYELADISSEIGLLQAGNNLLAIHGLNTDVNSSDFLIMPRLVATSPEQAAGVASTAIPYTGPIPLTHTVQLNARFRASTGTWSPLTRAGYQLGLLPASVANLILSEIHYHPLDADAAEQALGLDRKAFEFVELLNTGGETISLEQVRFTDGVDFSFDDGVIHSLAPLEHLLVVNNLVAFTTRYGSAASNRVAGVFSNNTSLSNGGETLSLQAADGEVISTLTYDDKAPWPTSPDGTGTSLSLVEPLAHPDLQDPANWLASPTLHGSPGIDNRDTDGDQVGDTWEITHFGNLDRDGQGDLDGDGLQNLQEFMLGTSPVATDSDGDQIPDNLEISLFNTDPSKADTDGDGASDSEELIRGMDPFVPDSDNDGLGDAEEIAAGSDGNQIDSDGDDFSDLLEVLRGTSPTDPADRPVSRVEDLDIYSSFYLDEFGTPTVLNLAGAHNGTPFGAGVTLGGGGITEAALILEAEPLPSGVDYGEAGAPGLDSLSISFWFSANTVTGIQTIISKGYAETNRSGWKVYLDQDVLYLCVSTDQREHYTARYPGIQSGQLYHAGFVINNDTGGLRAYLDGSSGGWDMNQAGLPRWSLVDSASPLRLGANPDRLEAFSGILDDLMVWHFPLGTDELNRIYQGGLAMQSAFDASGPDDDADFDGLPDDWEWSAFGSTAHSGNDDPDSDGLTNEEEFRLGTDPLDPDSDGDLVDDGEEVAQGRDPTVDEPISAGQSLVDGLLLYSHMDRDSVTSLVANDMVFDLTSPSEFGRLNGNFAFIAGVAGQALRSEGGIIDYGDVHPPGSNNYTVSLWVRPEGMEAGHTQVIAGKGAADESGQASGWHLVLFGEQFGACGGTSDGANWVIRNDLPLAGTQAVPGEWSHLVLILDRSSETAQLLVNGTEVGRAALSPGIPMNNHEDLIVGGPTPKEAGPNSYYGGVDEFAIWSRTLAPIEITALFHTGLVQSDLGSLTGSMNLPSIALGPEAGLSAMLRPSDMLETSVAVTNVGSGPLYWIAELSQEPVVPLESVLSNLNSGASSITSLIQNPFAFSEGQSGYFIQDGGEDMYDTGNILNTDHGKDIPYSNNAITSSTSLGAGGRYFTRKYNGLFVFAADVNHLDFFEITGDLGADGLGDVESKVFETTRGARRFTGYSKKVFNAFEPSLGTTDPSVNHLIIVESNDQVVQAILPDSNNDFHQISQLGGVTRLYYLLFATDEGSYVSDAENQAILEKFLDVIDEKASWLAVDGPLSGVLAPGESVILPLSLSASMNPSGVELNSALRIYSNDATRPLIEIPYSLYINAAPQLSQPPAFFGLEDTILTGSFLGFATDDDDGPELLTWNFEANPGETLIDQFVWDNPSRNLSLILQPDAFGFTTFSVIVTDSGGLSSTGLVGALVISAPDPIRSNPIAELVIPDTETGRVFAADAFIYDPDPADTTTYLLIGNTRPDLFSRIELDPSSGHLLMQFAPFVTGTAELTIAANSSGGDSATNTFSVTIGEGPPAALAVQTLLSNTPLREQQLIIRNDANYPVLALEIDISPLPDADRALNASTHDMDGSACVYYHAPIQAGQTISITIAYRSGTASPSLVFRTSPRGYYVPPGEPVFRLEQVQRRPDKGVQFQFPAFPGRSHQVEYADGFGSWTEAYRLPPAGTRILWRDDGPPLTSLHPDQAPFRMYRLKAIE